MEVNAAVHDQYLPGDAVGAAKGHDLIGQVTGRGGSPEDSPLARQVEDLLG